MIRILVLKEQNIYIFRFLSLKLWRQQMVNVARSKMKALRPKNWVYSAKRCMSGNPVEVLVSQSLNSGFDSQWDIFHKFVFYYLGWLLS